jgi:hypothetical protein
MSAKLSIKKSNAKTPVVVKHIESLNHCYTACKATYTELQGNQLKAMQQLLMKHMPELQKLGAGDVFVALIKKDLVSGLKAINALLKKKDFKKVLLAILDENLAMYKTNFVFVEQLITCYINKCNNEAIVITCELMELLINIVTLINDKQISKRFNAGKTLFLKNFQSLHSKVEKAV